MKVNKLFSFFSSQCFLKEIENMFSMFLSSYRNTRESLGELEKAAETLAGGSCSHSIFRSPKLPLRFLQLDRNTVHVFYFLNIGYIRIHRSNIRWHEGYKHGMYHFSLDFTNFLVTRLRGFGARSVKFLFYGPKKFSYVSKFNLVHYDPQKPLYINDTRPTRFLDSLRRRASARNLCFRISYGGQFTLSTQFVALSTTVSLETYPLYFC